MPPTITARVEALLDWGVDVEVAPGAATRGASPYAPAGGLWHWTAAPTHARGDMPSRDVCIGGRPGLPGPLCHDLMGRSGRVLVIARWTANHGGRGARGVVLPELAGGRADRRSAARRGLADTAAANSALHGLEVESTGEGLTAGQSRALPRYTAAICQLHGWDQRHWTHHGGWSRRKVDMLAYGDLWSPAAHAIAAGPDGDGALEEEEEPMKLVMVTAGDGVVWALSSVGLAKAHVPDPPAAQALEAHGLAEKGVRTVPASLLRMYRTQPLEAVTR